MLVRFWRGVVKAEAFGGYPEHLLSAAARSRVPLWDVQRDGLSVFFCCYADRYRELRPHARKSGVRMRVKQRHGLPFLLRPFRLRWGLAVGAVLSAVVLGLLSSRVWVITVEGNERLSRAAVLSVLEPLGVTVGADFDKVAIPQVQLAALQELPTVDWLTVNQQGCTVQVLLRERKIPIPTQDKRPANLVAVCDGVITDIQVFDGQAAVKVGDGVTAGSLLISGVTDSAVGPLLRRARGVVTAQVTQTLEIAVPLQETVRTAVRRRRYPTAVLFGWRLPLYTTERAGGVYTETTDERYLTARGRALPIGWTMTERTFFEDVTVNRTIEQAKAIAYERLARQEQALADTAVEDRAVTETTSDEAVTVTAVIVGTREIGVYEPIETS